MMWVCCVWPGDDVVCCVWPSDDMGVLSVAR